MRDARLHIRLPAELLDGVKKYAEKKGLSVATVVNSLLVDWVNHEKEQEHVARGLQFETEKNEPRQI